VSDERTIDPGTLLAQAIAALAAPRHATYRLQVGAALGFDDVAPSGTRGVDVARRYKR
jgi:hypothetical protein